MKKLTCAAVVAAGLLGALADVSQICQSVEGPLTRLVRFMAASSARRTGGDGAPVKRPAHLVLIIENTGEARDMQRVDSLVSSFSARLIPGDTLSTITFTDAGHRYILDRQSGDDLGEKLLLKVSGLVPVATLSQKVMSSAYLDAQQHLREDTQPSHTSAIVVLSPEVATSALDAWFRRIRSDATAYTLRFGPQIRSLNL